MLRPLTGPARPFFALIIGIDEYEPLRMRLSGCVADADDVATFLTECLGVSDNRIVNLRNETATCENIIRHIRALATDDRIATNDPILLYFAGQASRMQAPRALAIGETDAPVSYFLPYGSNKTSTHSLGDDLITSMKLNILFKQLAAVKGDNIVCSSLMLILSYSDNHAPSDRNI